jgi:hypothetical protein
MIDAEEILLEEDELENITGEQIDELERKIEDVEELLQGFSDDADDILEEINSTEIYEEMGVELHMNLDYQFYYSERDE